MQTLIGLRKPPVCMVVSAYHYIPLDHDIVENSELGFSSFQLHLLRRKLLGRAFLLALALSTFPCTSACSLSTFLARHHQTFRVKLRDSIRCAGRRSKLSRNSFQPRQ